MKIDHDAIKVNYLNIAKRCNKSVMAVIKANAYGLGIKDVAKDLATVNCPFFVVGSIDEALMIRKALIFTPILLLEITSEFRQIFALKVTLGITSLVQLKAVARSSLSIHIHLGFDIGMKRDGLNLDEMEEAIKIIESSCLVLSGIFAHHTGETNFNKEAAVFEKISRSVGNKLLIHHSASIGLIHEDDFSNAVRVGGAIYGLIEVEGLKLKPTVSLLSPIWHVNKVFKGERVGYEGGTPVPDKGYVYTIPFGYSDGWDRSRKILAWINEEILIQVGSMMMNHTLLFSKKELKVGLEVELLGEHLPLIQLAKSYKTIPYTLTSSLNSTLRRI